MTKYDLLQVAFIKRRKVKDAVFKINRKQQFVALLKMNAQQFAPGEPHIVEAGVCRMHHTHVAILKAAFRKAANRKVTVGEIAMLKTAPVIVSFLKAVCAKVDPVKCFVFYVDFIHSLFLSSSLHCMNLWA
jgi:hypothetical protein